MSCPDLLVQALIAKGVKLPHPASVYVADSVNLDRIHPEVTLHPGTRLLGAALSIGPGCEIGAETPATVIDCQLGRGVSLKGGYYEGSVFLDDSSTGSAAHVRPGCLLEEEASAAHAVGMKQTILFPFVTLGSLINFCDVWMCGGTSRRDHSEVGSSFIHFNFTPHGDKATPSLIGSVAEGVLLDQPPVFLGGQSGIVGPVQTVCGVVLGAGSLLRQDLNTPGELFQSGGGSEVRRPYTPGRVSASSDKLRKNLHYLGALSALKSWYSLFRAAVMSTDPHTRACVEGGVRLLAGSMKERRKQLEKWLGLVAGQLDDPAKRRGWESLSARIDVAAGREADADLLGPLLTGARPGEGGYVDRIRGLDAEARRRVREFFINEINRFVQLADEPSPGE
jgi:UDP-N-acetylglucosamine/UDP-N-acetylgalactosamine diphosphorylase